MGGKLCWYSAAAEEERKVSEARQYSKVSTPNPNPNPNPKVSEARQYSKVKLPGQRAPY